MTMHRPIAKTAAETMLALQFAALATSDPDRVAAFAAFEAEGLPTRRNEAWHYTDLRSAMTAAEPLAPAPDADRIEAARNSLAMRRFGADIQVWSNDEVAVSYPAVVQVLRGTLEQAISDFKPDVVHVMAKGRIVKTGGPELALELERNGYRDYADAAA